MAREKDRINKIYNFLGGNSFCLIGVIFLFLGMWGFEYCGIAGICFLIMYAILFVVRKKAIRNNKNLKEMFKFDIKNDDNQEYDTQDNENEKSSEEHSKKDS